MTATWAGVEADVPSGVMQGDAKHAALMDLVFRRWVKSTLPTANEGVRRIFREPDVPQNLFSVSSAQAVHEWGNGMMKHLFRDPRIKIESAVP